MFALVTAGTTMQLNVESISYINNRKFPGVEGVLSPGPLGYQWLIAPKPVSFLQSALFALSNWLADGLLVSSLLTPLSLILVSNANFSSSTVAISSTRETFGPSPSPASCTSAPWVRI